MATTESPSKFETTLNETTFAQFDWNTLSPTSTTAPSDGLKAVIDGLAARINAHAAAPDFASHSALYDVLNDLFCAYLLWDHFTPNILALIGATKSVFNRDCQLLALDILSMHFQRLRSKEPHSALYSKHCDLVRSLAPLFEETLFKTKVHSELASTLHLFTKMKLPKAKADAGAITLQDRRRKTRMYFVQNKFNLLIEETEGFAKLMTEIAEHLQQRQREREPPIKGEALQSAQSPQLLQTKIFRLIGQFKLDPNRYAVCLHLRASFLMITDSLIPHDHWWSDCS